MPIDRLELDKGPFTHRREGATEIVFEHRGSIAHGPDFYALWLRTKDDPPNGRFAGPGWKVLFGEIRCQRAVAIVCSRSGMTCAVPTHVGRGFVRKIAFEPNDDGSCEIARVRLSVDLYDGESKSPNWHSEDRDVSLVDAAWQRLKWWP